MERDTPEHINTFYGNGEDEASDEQEVFVEDLRPRLNMQPVFEKARLAQIEIATQECKPEDVGKMYNSLRQLTSALEAEAQQQGVIGQTVRLTGNGIVMPKIEIGLAEGMIIIGPYTPDEQQERLFNMHLDPRVAEGLFCGFTIRFNQIRSADGTIITEKPRLVYQVQHDYLATPFVQGPVFTTGEVGVTQLDFLDDDIPEQAFELMTKLYEIDDKEVHASVNALNMSLQNHEQHDASLIRHIAFHAERIVNNKVARQVPDIQDLVIDFMHLKINTDSRYNLSSKIYYSYYGEGKTRAMAAYGGDGSLFHYEHPIDSVIFMPKYKRIETGLVTKDRAALYAVLSSKEKTIYLPLSEIEGFEKQ